MQFEPLANIVWLAACTVPCITVRGGTVTFQLRPGLAGVTHFLSDPVAQSFSCDAGAFVMKNKSAKVLVSNCEAVESASNNNPAHSKINNQGDTPSWTKSKLPDTHVYKRFCATDACQQILRVGLWRERTFLDDNRDISRQSFGFNNRKRVWRIMKRAATVRRHKVSKALAWICERAITEANNR